MRLRANPDASRTEGDATGPTNAHREQIGRLLREAGVLSDADVQQVLLRQSKTGELFGEAAIALGLVNETQLRDAVGRQQSFFVLPAGTDTLDPLVVTAFDPGDRLSLEVRRLRGEIARLATEGDRSIRSVALMSFDANSERSLVAANLGVAFAQAGYHTLLIDSVLDEPRLHALLRLPNRSGVSTLLSSDVEAKAMVQPTAVPRLSFMAAGPSVPNVGELFDRQRLFRKLRPLSGSYDMVLVEVGGETALAASDGGDAVLMLVRRGVSDLREVRRVSDAIVDSGTVLLGSVMLD